MLTFALEAWPDVVGEMKLLFPGHWLEIGVDRGAIPMDMDFEMYEKYHEIGYLKITTVRADGKLVGYCMSLVCTHLHYRTTTFSLGDLYYIDPKYRDGAAGLRMFIEHEKNVRPFGVKKMTTITKLHHNRSAMFEKLGWKAQEITYTKVIE
jgi:hypothetical protein